MSDVWLLVEFEEGFTSFDCDNMLECPTRINDDYYNPVLIGRTRQDLVDFLGTENVTWNGDTATVKRYSWTGELKGEDTYYAIPVEFGKVIAY